MAAFGDNSSEVRRGERAANYPLWRGVLAAWRHVLATWRFAGRLFGGCTRFMIGQHPARVPVSMAARSVAALNLEKRSLRDSGAVCVGFNVWLTIHWISD